FIEEDEQDEIARRSIFSAGWFRALLVLTVLAIVVVVSLPYLLNWLEPTPGPPIRPQAQAPPPPSTPPPPSAPSQTQPSTPPPPARPPRPQQRGPAGAAGGPAPARPAEARAGPRARDAGRARSEHARGQACAGGEGRAEGERPAKRSRRERLVGWLLGAGGRL